MVISDGLNRSRRKQGEVVVLLTIQNQEFSFTYCVHENVKI